MVRFLGQFTALKKTTDLLQFTIFAIILWSHWQNSQSFFGIRFGLNGMMLYLVFRNAKKKIPTQLPKNKVITHYYSFSAIWLSGGYFFRRIRVRETNSSWDLPSSPSRSRNLSWSGSCGALNKITRGFIWNQSLQCLWPHYKILI